MNTQETILQLEGLKLKGMAECYKALHSMPVNQWPTLDTFIARLAEAEQQYRNRKRTEMYLKTSKRRNGRCNLFGREEPGQGDAAQAYGLHLHRQSREPSHRRQDRMRKIVLGMRHRKTGLFHGTQGGILLYEQVHRAHRARQT